MNHFRSRLTSPLLSVLSGYVYIAGLAVYLYVSGFYGHSSFFSWGVPVTFMGVTVESEQTYYTILGLFFVHQLVNNWVNDVTYPFIVNCIQDPKSVDLVYSRSTCMIIVNLFALYSELDVILIISGVMSQISFFVVLILANMVSSSVINWRYVRGKREPAVMDESLYSIV